MTIFTILDSPVGPLGVTKDDRGALTEIRFLRSLVTCKLSPEAFADVAAQLDEYFAGERKTFDLPLAPRGTPFQRSVWDELLRIPYGATKSYRDIANAIGKPAAVRAVGAANGANPLPIVVPCHRVVGANGSLTGFGGGIDVKRRLLALEGAIPRELLHAPPHRT